MVRMSDVTAGLVRVHNAAESIGMLPRGQGLSRPNRCASYSELKETVVKGDVVKLKTLLSKCRINHVYTNAISNHLLLHEAARRGFSEVLDLLLEFLTQSKKTDIFLLEDHRGNLAVHEAIENKRADCVLILMEFNPDAISATDAFGNTPVQCLVKNKCLEGVQKCIHLLTPELINAFNEDGLSAVHIAAREDAVEILNVLIAHGGDVEAVCSSGKAYSPVHYAVETGSGQGLNTLLSAVGEGRQAEYVSKKTSDGRNCIMLAAKNGYPGCVLKLLLMSDVDEYDSEGFTALHLAILNMNVSVVKILLGRKANVFKATDGGETPFSLAARSSNACLELLLEKHPNPEDPGKLLKIATQHSNEECLKLLLRDADILKYINHPFPEEGHDTPLHISTRSGSNAVTQLLLDHKADKLLKNHNNEYPFHLAARNQPRSSMAEEKIRIEICRSLLKNSHKKIRETTKDTHETALHLAASSGNMMMVISLVKKGCRVLDKESTGVTCIHLAAKNGHANVLEYLLKQLDDSQRKDLIKIYPHPLHYAAQHDHLDCCKIVVEWHQGQSQDFITSQDCDKNLPLDLASREKDCECFRYLIGQMAFDPANLELGRRVHKYFQEAIDDHNTYDDFKRP